MAILVLAAGLYAQKDVTKFLGIPVDGTKQAMIQKLKAKGFTYNQKYSLLEGEFNGENVRIHIVTQGNKVWRIMVPDKSDRDEAQIRLRFNKLLSQFKNNPKYSGSVGNKRIDDDEDISYNISILNKQYEALFFQKTIDGEIDFNKQVWFTISEFQGEYYIIIYYDNNYNEADGSDL